MTDNTDLVDDFSAVYTINILISCWTTGSLSNFMLLNTFAGRRLCESEITDFSDITKYIDKKKTIKIKEILYVSSNFKEKNLQIFILLCTLKNS